MRIFYQDELINHRNSINQLYLKVGNYQEILNMCYWNFISVLNTLIDNNKRESGESIVREGLTEKEKDMIERKKTLNKRNK